MTVRSMVYYRKYRPQTIEELDSKEVRDKLYSVLESPSVAHAFLFIGPKGLGKTSAARIVAKSLNCEEHNVILSKAKDPKNKRDSSAKPQNDIRKRVEPCNKCDQCKSITNGTNLDILEIDGASNRGIDEIRDLREKIKLSPSSARKKVYIIDEVHMLTTEAFNALLKTLEEPPSHAVFVLCTTEPHKVPATISSRCLQIQFKKATKEELARSFRRIIKAEKLTADEDALCLIAGLSDGSFRDGVKILEEMVYLSRSEKDKKITKELVEQKHQVSSIQYQIVRMIRSLETKDAKSALEIVAKITNEGVDIKYFMEELVNKLHLLLLAKFGVGDELEIARPPATLPKQSNAKQASVAGEAMYHTVLGEVGRGNWKLEIGELKSLIEIFSKAASELKYAVLPQIPLELAIVEWILTARQPRVSDDARLQNSGSESLNSASLSKIRHQASTQPNFNSSESGLPRRNHVLVKSSFRGESHPPISISQQNITSYNENDALWTALIDKVKAYNHSIAGVLRGCRIKSYDGKNLIIETNFKFHKEKLSETKTQEILNKTVRDIAKKDVKIEVLLKSR